MQALDDLYDQAGELSDSDAAIDLVEVKRVPLMAPPILLKSATNPDA